MEKFWKRLWPTVRLLTRGCRSGALMRLSFAMLACLMVTTAWAGEKTVEIKQDDAGSEVIANPLEFTKGDITLSFSSTESSTKFELKSQANSSLVNYKGISNFKISVSSAKGNITKVVISYKKDKSGNTVNSLTDVKGVNVSVTSGDLNSDYTELTNVNAKSVDITATHNNTSQQTVRIVSVAVTYDDSSLPTPQLTLSGTSDINCHVGDTPTGYTVTMANTIADTDRPAITWSSSDTDVITVDASTGKLGTALSAGTATITATTAATSRYASTSVSYKVNVTTLTPVLTLSGTSDITCFVGDTPTGYTVTMADTDNTIADADRPEITWSSSATGVITVDASTGELGEALSAGMATITATTAATSKYASTSVSYKVTVKSTARSEYDENRAVGWASEDNYTMTGGEGGKVYVVDTREKLIEAMQGEDPAIVYVKGTIYFNGADTLYASKNKSLIGLPGAKLQNAVERYGTLKTNSSYSGGKYKTCGDLNTEEGQEKIWNWIKTTMNVDSTGILCLYQCENIIIRNLDFEAEGSYDLDGKDNLTLHESKHIWVDHCSFHDGIDGNFDCIHGSDYISVTWCKFYYSKKARTEGYTGDSANGHNDSNLWGHNDKNADQDSGHLNTTFANCWWESGCEARMPMVRFAEIHMYNCYNENSKSNAVNPRLGSSVYVEKCVFENGSGVGLSSNSGECYYNVVDCLQKGKDYNKSEGSGTPYTPSYTYNSYDVSKTKDVVTADNGAGPTLAISEPTSNDNPTQISITSKKEYTTLCSAYPLDFSNNDNVKAYVATNIETAGTGSVRLKNVTLTRVKKVAAGTGLVIKGTAGTTYSIDVLSEDVDKPAVNYLYGTVTKKWIGMNKAYWFDESSAPHRRLSQDFVLSGGKFCASKPGRIAAAKAYLAAPMEMNTITEYDYKAYTVSASIQFDDSEVTGISETLTPDSGNNAWYTLTGVRIEQPQQPGIYIRAAR